MINIKQLNASDVGRWVVYTPDHISDSELGRIKSWNDIYVFVVYKCNNNWDDFKNYTGCSTDPKELTFKVDHDAEQAKKGLLKEIIIEESRRLNDRTNI